jgi:hypothetical protein
VNATEFHRSNNGSPDTWTKVNIPYFKYTDSIGIRSRLIQATIPDPGNMNIDDFFAYQRIKLIEKQTGDNNQIFLGRVEDVAPQFHDTLGQVIVVTCRDYIQELMTRTIDINYSVSEVRSAKINRVITDYMYTGASFPRTIETSGSSSVLTRDMRNSKVSPLEFIEEMAREDPWTDITWNSPAGAVWLWNNSGSSWVNDTVEADSAVGTPFALMGAVANKRYFGRNNPFAGFVFDLSVFGSYGTITYKYWNGSIWATLVPTNVYTFGSDGMVLFDPPADWVAKAFSAGDPHPTAPPDTTSRFWIRLEVSSITTDATVYSIQIVQGNGYDYRVDDEPRFRYFRRGSIPAGGPVGHGLTIEYGGTPSGQVTPMLGDYELSNTPQEIITRVIVRGTDASGVSITGTATNAALEAQLKIVKEHIDVIYGTTTTDELTRRAQALLRERGVAKIQRGKVAIPGLPFYTIGGTCYLVRAGDLVRIKCAPKEVDDDFLVLEMEYEEPACITTLTLLSHAWGRGWVTGDLASVITELREGLSIPMARIGDLVVGTAKIVDLSVTTAKINNLAVTEAKIANLAVTEAKIANLAVTTAKIDDLAVTNAKIDSCSISKLTAGNLDVIGTITSLGKLRTAASGARIEITQTLIVGYNSSGVAQFYLQASDGKAYAAAGNIILDSTGLSIKGEFLMMKDTGGTLRGTLYGTSQGLEIAAQAGTIGVVLDGSPAGGDVAIATASDLAVYSSVQQKNSNYNILYDIRPFNTTSYLGSSSYPWERIYVKGYLNAATPAAGATVQMSTRVNGKIHVGMWGRASDVSTEWWNITDFDVRMQSDGEMYMLNDSGSSRAIRWLTAG